MSATIIWHYKTHLVLGTTVELANDENQGGIDLVLVIEGRQI